MASVSDFSIEKVLTFLNDLYGSADAILAEDPLVLKDKVDKYIYTEGLYLDQSSIDSAVDEVLNTLRHVSFFSQTLYTSGGLSMGKNKSQINSVGTAFRGKPTREAMNRAFELYSMGDNRDKVEMVLRQEFPEVTDFTDMLNHIENVGLESWPNSSVKQGSPNLKDTIKSAKEMKLQIFDSGAFKLDLSQEKDNSLLCSTVKGACDVGAVLSVASRDGYTFQDLSQGVDLSSSPLLNEYKDLLVSTAVLKPEELKTVKRQVASGVVSGKELDKELQQWGLDNPGQVFQSMQVLGTDLAGGDSVKSVGVPIRSSQGTLGEKGLSYFSRHGITQYAIANGHVCFKDPDALSNCVTVSIIYEDGDIGNGWGIRAEYLPAIQAFLDKYGDAVLPEGWTPLGQSAKTKMIKVNNKMVPLSRLLSSKLGFKKPISSAKPWQDRIGTDTFGAGDGAIIGEGSDLHMLLMEIEANNIPHDFESIYYYVQDQTGRPDDSAYDLTFEALKALGEPVASSKRGTKLGFQKPSA
jgi:hypothetical protein